MNWRIFIAVCLFLLMTLFSSVGGCVIGFLAAYPGQGGFILVWVVWGAGTLVGIGIGLFLALTLLRNSAD